MAQLRVGCFRYAQKQAGCWQRVCATEEITSLPQIFRERIFKHQVCSSFLHVEKTALFDTRRCYEDARHVGKRVAHTGKSSDEEPLGSCGPRRRFQPAHANCDLMNAAASSCRSATPFDWA